MSQNTGRMILRKYIELQAHRNKLIGKYSAQMGQNFFAVYPMIVLIALPAALVTFLAYCLLGSNNEILLCVVFIFVLIVDMLLTFNSEKIIDEEEMQLQNKKQFYSECQSLGIGRNMEAYHKQKAELIAQRLGCKYTDIVQYYIEAEGICLEDADKRKQEELEQIKDAEILKQEAYTRYCDYYGRNKRIAMLEDSQTYHRRKAEEMKKSTRDVIKYSLQREKNPGVAGGIMAGLFGDVAGVAAYMDTENQNAQIRAQNKATMDALTPGVMAVDHLAYEHEREADKLQHSIDDAKIKLVSETPCEKVFSYIAVSNEKIEISETGAFTITADIQVTADKQLLKVGNADGVIDGAIAARLYQKGNCVGSALMSLPTFGMKDKASIKGIDAYACADKSLPYTIKILPHKLWIMEE